jgi:hypothetical protein
MSGVVRSMFSDRQLHAGEKLPSWQPRRGVVLDFSSLHSSEVPLVLNLQTGSITPQYHVVFDNHFSTVTSIAREDEPPVHWGEICLENTTYIHMEHILSDTTVYLEDDWLTPLERAIKVRQMQHQDTVCWTYELPVDTPPDPNSSCLSCLLTVLLFLRLCPRSTSRALRL